MQTSTLEETKITENEQQPEATTLVPTEPEIIEGEVIVIEPPESTEDHVPPKQKPYWLLVPFTILCCLIFLAGSYILPLLTPTATITIVPVEKHVSLTAAIPIHARLLPTLTLSQSQTVPATGKQHQNTTRAHGIITFYNGQFAHLTLAAGTILTGSDGVKVITDQSAYIPAGNPPMYGQTSVPSHALSAGLSGNIPAYDINTACCLSSVLAKNTTAFTGGAETRDSVVVTKADITSAKQSLSDSLTASEQAAVTAQLHPGEALIPIPCTLHSAGDHKPGDEATQVTVTVSETCSGIAYFAHDVYANATQILTTEATKRFGTGYSPVGDIQTTIVLATVPSIRQGKAQIIVRASGIWAYQITPRIQKQLAVLIAGSTPQQAERALLHVPGIAGAQISLGGGYRTLPQDLKAIRILVKYTPGQTQM